MLENYTYNIVKHLDQIFYKYYISSQLEKFSLSTYSRSKLVDNDQTTYELVIIV